MEAEEGQLLVEGGDTVVSRKVDASGAVVGQNVSEQFRIAVEKVLGRRGVVEVVAFVGAKQRRRELVEHVTPRLEHVTGNVDAHAVGAGSGPGGRRSGEAAVLEVRRQRVGGDRNPADRGGAHERKPRRHRRHRDARRFSTSGRSREQQRESLRRNVTGR